MLIWVATSVVFVIATRALLDHRSRLNSAHIVLVYLLLVLGASAWGGRLLGVTLSLLAFLTFDWLFIPPYETLAIRDPFDWLVLATFLLTSLVAAQLLYKARAERVAAERARVFREADRLKDALLASVSHDLRTPLTMIKGLANELQSSASPEITHQHAVLIEEQADRLNRLVTDLLDAARLDGGALPLEIAVNAVDDVLGTLVTQFRGRADRHRVHVRVDSAQVLLGRFDFVHTLRILTNLVENALKYAPVDTPVEVVAAERGGRLTFEVRDHGPGVPRDLSERLFEPFARSGIGTPDAGSAGLGLSIAKRLAEAQNGTVTYRPTSGGARFVVELPSAPPQVLR